MAKKKAKPKAPVEQTYNVQFLVVREAQVEALDDLQAEKAAYAQLTDQDQGAAIAICVLERYNEVDGGALREGPVSAWRFAKDHFHPLDPNWLRQEDN